MLRILPAALIAAVALVPNPAFAEKLTLERLFASPALAGPTPRSLKLSPDGSLATVLRNRPDDVERFDLWAIDTRNGKARMLVNSKKIGTGAELSEAEKMQRERLRIGGTKGIVAYDWAPDGKRLLVPIDGDLSSPISPAACSGSRQAQRPNSTPPSAARAASSPMSATAISTSSTSPAAAIAC